MSTVIGHGNKMATVENCSLADRMDRVYEKDINSCSPDDCKEQRDHC